MIRHFVCFVCLILLAACSTAPRSSDKTSASASSTIQAGADAGWATVDDFLSGMWAHDGSGNHARFERETIDSGSSERLVVHHHAGPRPQVTLRREVAWDLSEAGAFAIRLHSSADGPVSLAIGFRAQGGAVFETAPQELAAGWNDLVFDLAAMKDGTDLTAWTGKRIDINRLLLQIIPGDGMQRGTLRLDRLQVDKQTSLVRAAPTEIHDLSGPSTPIAKHALAEWTCRLVFHDRPPAKPGQVPPLLRHMTDLEARLVAPDGSIHQTKGFCTGIAADGSHRYALRLAPWMSGVWQIRFAAAGPGDATVTPVTSFTVVDGELPGPIAIDAGNPHYFVDGHGAFFWPIGQNICWVGDPEPWLDELAAAGGNWTRVWLCAWGIDLTVANRLEQIDFAAAEELDRYLQLAGERGIAVQLVMMHHGSLGWDWSRNPFNQANGGCLVVPEDFWTDWRAKALFRRYADYLIARYGAYQGLMAWELWNEADLTRPSRGDDIAAWHRELSAHLRSQDIHQRLITTSVHAPYRLREIFDDRNIDFEPAHRYSPQATLSAARLQARPSHKPQFYGEFGSEWREELAARDTDSLYFRQAIFAAWCQGLAGAAMPWWWDVTNREHDLLRHATQLKAFIADGDFRRDPPQIRRLQLGQRAQALLALQRAAAWIYICDPDRPREPADPPVTPLLDAGRQVTLSGLVDGAYLLTPTTADGEGAAQTVTVSEGRCTITLPAIEDDLALRLQRIDTLPLDAVLAP